MPSQNLFATPLRSRLGLSPRWVLGISSLGLALACGGGGSSTAPVQPPVITTPVAAETTTLGQTATFSVVATGSAPLTYQWYTGGATPVAIPAATSASYTTPPVTASTVLNDTLLYSVTVTNPAGSASSYTGTLYVSGPPIIGHQPFSQSVVLGLSSAFSVDSVDADPSRVSDTCQWYRNGNLIPGATGQTYTLATTTAADDGAAFTVAITGGGGTVTSSPAILSVGKVPPLYTVSYSTLYRTEVSATGTDTAIGSIQLANGSPISVTDIAVTPSGSAFVCSFSSLYSLNLTTAVATPIGLGTLTNVNALCSDPTGNLFGADTAGAYYSISKTDGTAKQLGTLAFYSSNYSSSGDMTFDQFGQLWVAGHNAANTGNYLILLDPTRQVADPVTPTPAAIYGLTFLDGVFYCLSGADNGLYASNSESGGMARIRTLAFSPTGSE
jgi:hypothetical protein